MFERLRCLFKGHQFSFTPEYLDKFHPADDNAIRCRCRRCKGYFDLLTGDARKMAANNAKHELKTVKETEDYCSQYLRPIRFIGNRPVFKQSEVDRLHIIYPQEFKNMCEE